MRLYFIYADHIPDQHDKEILMSSYSDFEWNKTQIPMEEEITDQCEIYPDDIVVKNNEEMRK